MRLFVLVCCLLAFAASAVGAASIVVDASKPGVKVAPTMYGLFFEDINHAADGGLYAEMVRNRGFEDYRPSEGAVRREDGWWISGAGHGMKPDESNNSLVGWNLAGSGGALTLDRNVGLNPKTSSSGRLEITEAGGTGIANVGYWGMSVKSGEKYNLTYYVKSQAAYGGKLTAYLESADGKAISNKVTATGVNAKWRQFKAAFTATGTDPKARLVIMADAKGTLWFDFVSLFPAKTFKNRPNGFRPEIAQLLADVKPGFMRWPGGCIVEGVSLANAYDWKTTIGPIEERPGKWNLWGYRRTDGFGYHEFLQLAEDLGCEPLMVVNAGQSCNYRTPEFAPMDKMDKYVQDTLDAIDYANGPVTSKWGALRAKAGHPKPYNLKYLEIGNENWGPEYAKRYILIYEAVKKKYPYIITIANATEAGMKFDINDEHFYEKPEFFQDNVNKYDNYDRKAHKVFIGEVACTQGCGKTGNLRAALGEAAFLIGAERNADIVQLISYAPLFVNTNDRRWSPDAIVYDSSRVFVIPSYYLYKMFGTNRPDYTLPLTLDATPVNPTFPGRIGVGSIADTKSEFKDIKVEKDGKALFESDFSKGSEGWQTEGGKWEVVDGCLRQERDGKAFAGDKNWEDYTLTLKARKISGNEGFVIYFSNGPWGEVRWNLGGWGNTQHALEGGGIPQDGKPGKIESDKWYDIKIELKGPSVRCYLDGKLIHDVKRSATSMFAVAGKEEKTGDIIIKVSNPTQTAYAVDVKINGAGKVASNGTQIVMTSGDPWDENSFEEPTKVAPVTGEISGLGSAFNYTFKPYSLTILRLKTK